MPYNNRQVLLTSTTTGLPEKSNFELAESVIENCEPEHLIVRNHFLSADPAQKGWMSPVQNYASARVGDPMRAFAVGEVLESNLPGYSAGEFVVGLFGWQEYAHVSKNQIQRKLDPGQAPIQTSLGVLGIAGLTSYIVLADIIRLEREETLVVSSAAGAVGSVAGQLGREAGCRVVGLTGSDEKVELACSEFGYHECLNYRDFGDTDQLAQALNETCPNGIDGFLDCTGGSISDAVIAVMNNRGRIAQVGTANVAAWNPIPQGPRRERQILVKELRQQGFIIFNHSDRFPEAIEQLSSRIQNGSLSYREHLFEGLESAPDALISLYQGTNMGKALVQLDLSA